MKAAGITLMTMAVGGLAGDENLIKWATKPEYFVKAGFKDLTAALNKVKSTMCQGGYL